MARPGLSKARRLAYLVLVLVAYVLLLVSLAGCGLIHDTLRGAGSAISEGAADGVRQDVAAVGGWVRDLVLIIVGALTSESGRYVHRVRKRRRESRTPAR